MKQLIILGVISLIILVSCTLAKKPRYNSQDKEEINIVGKITTTKYKIPLPCSIYVFSKKDSLFLTSSDDSGNFTLTLKNKYIGKNLKAIIKPIKDRVRKDTVNGIEVDYVLALCKNKDNDFRLDTFNFVIQENTPLFWKFENCTFLERAVLKNFHIDESH